MYVPVQYRKRLRSKGVPGTLEPYSHHLKCLACYRFILITYKYIQQEYSKKCLIRSTLTLLTQNCQYKYSFLIHFIAMIPNFNTHENMQVAQRINFFIPICVYLQHNPVSHLQIWILLAQSGLN